MALLSYALTSVEAVEKQLDKTLTADETTVIENMINQSTQYAEKYIGRYIKGRGEDLEEKIDVVDYRNAIFVTNFPIISITSIEEDSSAVSSDDYYIYANEGMLRRKNADWAKGYQVIVITYQGGYATVPEDIEQWCINLVVTMFKDRDRGNVTSEKVGDLSVSYGNIGEWISNNSFSKGMLDLYKSNIL